jgi:hypothetical protein
MITLNFIYFPKYISRIGISGQQIILSLLFMHMVKL